MKKIFYTWKQFDEDVVEISKYIKKNFPKAKYIYGFPKGGLVLAVALANRLKLKFCTDTSVVDIRNIHQKLIIVDDIVDSGKTMMQIDNLFNYNTISLCYRVTSRYQPTFFCRECFNEWVVFPWEPKNKKMERDNK